MIAAEYFDHINALLQAFTATDGASGALAAEEFKKTYAECDEFLEIEYRKLYADISKISYKASLDEKTIEEKCQQWQILAEKMHVLLQTKGLAERLGKKLESSKSWLLESQQKISITFLIKNKIHQLMISDSSFHDSCNQMSDDFQQNIIELIKRAYPNYEKENPLSKKYTDEEILTKTLKIMPKWILLAKKYHVSESDYYYLLKLWFKSFATENTKKIEKAEKIDGTEKTEKVIDFAFEIIAQTKNPAKALKNLSRDGLNSPSDFTWSDERKERGWTIEDLENRFRLLQKLEQDPARPVSESVFNRNDKGALTLDENVAIVYEKYPELYWRLKKHGIEPNLNPYFYLDADNIALLTNFFEIISPDDVKELLGQILYKAVPADKIPDLVKILSWMRDSIVRDSSTLNREKMSEFVHRILALMRDNIQLAEQIFTLPPEKYSSLCEFMQDKYSFDELSIEDFESVFQDDKQRMAKVICELFNNAAQQNATLILPMHFWLNTILKIHDGKFDKSSPMTLSSKLEKLPQHYLQVIRKMLKVTNAQPECIEHFIALASALPYSSESMKTYLEKLEKIKDENRLATMEAFNMLVSDNPELLPQFLGNLEIITLLKKLKETDLSLFLTLTPNMSLNKECVEKIIADEALRSRFAVLLKIEKERSIDLVSIFLNNTQYLDSLKDPLLKTLVSYPAFSEQISRAYSRTFADATEARAKQLAQLNKLLTSDPKNVFELFAFSGENCRTQRHFLGASVENDTFFTHDVTGKDKVQTLYHLARAFYQTYQVSHPDYVKCIAWLMENLNDEDSVALQLIKASNNESMKSYLVNFFHLAQQGYYSVVKTIFDKLEKKPDDSFILKLLMLASEKNGSLIEACLTVDETKENEFYNYIQKNSVAQLSSCQFSHIMTLRSQGETEKYKKQLQTGDTPEPLLDVKHSDTAEIKCKTLEKTLFSFMDPEDIKALDEKGLNAKQWVKFTLGIGHILVSERGFLTTDIIEKIKTTPAWEKLKHTPLFKNYLDRVLLTFKQYPAFAERLQELEAPIPGSLAESIIRSLLKLTKEQIVTAYHARVAVISTLLNPIIQDSVGSCFATSILIQASSNPDGLLQMLEDYMSLISCNHLTRIKRTVEKQPVEYPMEFNFADFAKMFAGDNLLSRAYEYTAARMAASYQDESSVKPYIKTNLALSFGDEAKVWLEDEPEIWLKFREILDSVAEEVCSVTYDGYTKNTYTHEQGSWLLQDAETHQSLIQDEKVESHFYDKMLDKCKKKLMESMPDKSTLITELFDGLHAFSHTVRFRKQLFAHIGYDSTGVARINGAKYYALLKRTPYRLFEGGVTGETIKNYHVRDVVDEYLPCQYNPLVSLEKFAANIPDEKDTNSDRWMNWAGQGHAFTINISKIKQLAKKGANVVTQEMRDAANALAKLACSQETYQTLTEYYVSHQNYPNTDIRNLHKKLLMRNLSDYHCLNDLCQEIVTTDKELTGGNRRSVGRLIDDAIRLNPALQDKLPPVFFFAESNEEVASKIGLTCRVHDKNIDYVHATDTNKHVPDAWSPRSLWNCRVFRHPSGADDISRAYFRKNR